MSWIIKDHYEDTYEFEVDKMALESMDITAFTSLEHLTIEVPVDEQDIEKIEKVYETLFPGLFEDMDEMMRSEDRDPYKVQYFYKKRSK